MVRVPMFYFVHLANYKLFFFLDSPFREDYFHGFTNIRSVLAKSNTEWENPKAFTAFLEASGLEAQKYKTCINYYACFAQKPLK